MLVNNPDRYRKAWKPAVNKRYANEYITKELIETYKREIEIKGDIIVPALIFDLMVFVGACKTLRADKKLKRAITIAESPNDWNEKDFRAINKPTFDKVPNCML